MPSNAAPQHDPFGSRSPAGIPATQVLGLPVSLVTIETAVNAIINWIDHKQTNYVCIRDVHGVMRAQEDSLLMEIHHKAGMVTPDGMPLVWIANHRGHRVSRVCGPDLVAALCAASIKKGFRHYFYGGKPGVAERMVATLGHRFPGLIVAGMDTPPFRSLTTAEDSAAVAKIVNADPHIIWVGLSTPKQEYWMRDHVDRIPGATLIGVGAAFDFYAGDIKRAPKWMQRTGLEWLHRLASEPRRLWKRYLVLAPQFATKVALREWRT